MAPCSHCKGHRLKPCIGELGSHKLQRAAKRKIRFHIKKIQIIYSLRGGGGREQSDHLATMDPHSSLEANKVGDAHSDLPHLFTCTSVNTY